MKFRVEEEDIATGRVGSNEQCPIANGLKRHLDWWMYASVGRATVITDGKRSLSVALPAPLRQLAIDFDERKPVEPVEVDWPELGEALQEARTWPRSH